MARKPVGSPWRPWLPTTKPGVNTYSGNLGNSITRQPWGSEAKASTTGWNGEKKALSPSSLTPCSANFSWMATTPAGSSGNSNPAGLTQQIQGDNFDRRIMRTEGMAIRLGFSLRRERGNERPTQGALASASRALRHSPGLLIHHWRFRQGKQYFCNSQIPASQDVPVRDQNHCLSSPQKEREGHF